MGHIHDNRTSDIPVPTGTWSAYPRYGRQGVQTVFGCGWIQSYSSTSYSNAHNGLDNIGAFPCSTLDITPSRAGQLDNPACCCIPQPETWFCYEILMSVYIPSIPYLKSITSASLKLYVINKYVSAAYNVQVKRDISKWANSETNGAYVNWSPGGGLLHGSLGSGSITAGALNSISLTPSYLYPGALNRFYISTDKMFSGTSPAGGTDYVDCNVSKSYISFTVG
jgi:hypothetical protein